MEKCHECHKGRTVRMMLAYYMLLIVMLCLTLVIHNTLIQCISNNTNRGIEFCYVWVLGSYKIANFSMVYYEIMNKKQMNIK